jgi:uncharacterized protein YkwD
MLGQLRDLARSGRLNFCKTGLQGGWLGAGRAHEELPMTKRGLLSVLLPIALIGASPSAWAADYAAEVSAYRRSHGLGAVKTDGALTAAAQRQATAMAGAGTVSHDIAGSFGSRMAGLAKGPSAENVAAGKPTFAATMRQWDESAGHKRNLLMAGATRVGVASATNAASRYKTFWVLIITN